jgi:hypothetical protein
MRSTIKLTNLCCLKNEEYFFLFFKRLVYGVYDSILKLFKTMFIINGIVFTL